MLTSTTLASSKRPTTPPGSRVRATARDQYDVGPQRPLGAPLKSGDLVFLGGEHQGLINVRIYRATRGGEPIMVDAPPTDTDLRTEPCRAPSKSNGA